MKRIHQYIFLVSLLFLTTVISCKKSYTYPSDKVSDYTAFQVGKYITYRLDSLVFINFGTEAVTFSLSGQRRWGTI